MDNAEIWEERREVWTKRPDDARTQYEVDFARINHSASFRRLGAVTQVISGEGSLARTRLTHSLEVAQIASGVVQRFRLEKDLPDVLRTHLVDPTLMQTIALTHDLGHPAFGHAGEEALNCAMRKDTTSSPHYGFEGNGQTLRVLSKLEDFSETAGSNLTRRSLLGILKYPTPYSAALRREVPGPYMTDSGVAMIRAKDHAPPKCYLDTEREVVDWLLEPLGREQAAKVVATRAKSCDAAIMDLCDDLAYSFGDLDDAITMDMINRDQLMEDVPSALWYDFIEYSQQRHSDTLFGDATGYDGVIRMLFSGSRDRKRQIGRLTGYGIARATIRTRPEFTDPLYAHTMVLENNTKALVEAIKRSILERVILNPKLQHGRQMSQMATMKVMDVLKGDPRHHLPPKQYRRYRDAGHDDRIICDWIAGSSETFVLKLHQRIFQPGAASVTDRL